MRFFTSDQHFGHDKIIELCDRPFKNARDMDSTMVDWWNEIVTDDDEVWVLGDWVMGRFGETLELTRQLNGHKILVAGNHDRCWFGQHPKQAIRYLDAGFEQIVQGYAEIMVDGNAVRLCHFPYRGDHTYDERYKEQRPKFDQMPLLHGHVHTFSHCDRYQFNVGVDVNGFRPVSEDTIIGWLKRRAGMEWKQ